MEEILGYIFAILVGISLGLVGSGGSILTLPILTYLMHIPTTLATTSSLLVVGASALVGAIRYAWSKEINYIAVLWFGIPSSISVFLTKKYILHSIPEHIGIFGTFDITKDLLLMILFSILMIVSSYKMIKGNSPHENQQEVKTSYLYVLLQGLFIGMITGLLGAGGGFLIIPALVYFLKIPMKTAIGTSLSIIFINAIIGIASDSHQNHLLDYHRLIPFTVMSILGMFIGFYLSKKIEGQKLKKGFGWFILAMGVYIILKELVFA